MIPNNDNNGGRERRTLWIVLLLNAAIAAGFFISGFFADSSALIANGVDNLSDTAVYALSLVALTRGETWKTRAATASGVMLLIFAGGILIDVGRRYLQGSEPIGPLADHVALENRISVDRRPLIFPSSDDQAAGLVGGGAVLPGQLAIILGNSAVVNSSSDRPPNSGNLGVGALTVANMAIARAVATDMGLTPRFTIIGMRDDGAVYVSPAEADVFVMTTRTLLDPSGALRVIGDQDCILDIGAGDSFADIYGLRRFMFLWLTKMQAVAARTPLVLSPQTIGPFTRSRTSSMVCGSAALPRNTSSVTLLPAAPRMRRSPSNTDMPRVARPSIPRTKSPVSRPALAAGDPGRADITRR